MWLPVSEDAAVGGSPVAVVADGVPLVLLRPAPGAPPVAYADRCPHRLVPLSAATAQDGRLQCAYHGWQFGAEVRLFGPGTPWQPGPFFADIDGRIGYYRVSANTDFTLVPSTGGLFTGGNIFTRHGSIYEAGVTLGYQVTPNWEVRAGYRFLSIEDGLFVADYVVASTANSTQAAVPAPRRLDLHMATVGTRLIFP